MKRNLLLLASVLLAIGCRTARRGEPFTGPHQWQQPAVQRGELVFAKNCYQCHPGGEAGLAPAINDKPAPVWLMKTQVRVGLGAMPSFGEDQISSSDLNDLMAYVMALRKEK
jgi:mono/diheme cytochrome c family protein